MDIAIFSGELSGDLIGGALAQELRRLVPDVTLWGLGSAAMRQAGVDLLGDSAAWGAISITQAIGQVPNLLFHVYPRVRRALRRRRPDVVVLIDFGAFNVRVARYARQIGLKVCYYFPPGSWRRTGTQGAALATFTDVLATPFPWSAERYRGLGANAVYVGHPLLERAQAVMSRAEFAAHFDMDPLRPIIGLLPGSRRHEIEHLMPTLIDTARLIQQTVKDAQFVVGVAPSVSLERMAAYLTGQPELLARLNEIWHEFAQEAETKIWKPVVRTAGALKPKTGRKLVTVGGVVVPEEAFQEEMEARRRAERRSRPPLPPIVLAKGLTYDVMAHSDLLLTCSGTATLEAALFGTPMVILYRGPKIMEIEYHLRRIPKKIPHIGLPNILSDRRIVPELIQWDATPDNIARHGLEMLTNPERRHQVKQDLQAVRDMLGEPGASARTARLIVDLANRS